MPEYAYPAYNAGPTYGSQANTQAADIAFSIHTQVDARFYDIKYPDHEWYRIVSEDQVMDGINAGATSYSYITRDKQGMAAFIGNGINMDIPMVGQSAGSVIIPIAYSAVSAQVTNEDARQYAFGFNGNLAQDLGFAMRQACDNLVESTVIFGNEPLNLNPWINYPGLTVYTATTGASGKTTWESKTPEEVIADVNLVLGQMWERSRTLFKPTDIWLPLSKFAILSSRPMVLGGVSLAMTILNYLRENNVMTRVTGKPLNFIPSRYLSNAGAGSTADAPVARMVVADRSADNQCLPFPLPYLLSAPIPVPLAAQWYAEQKFGSYHVRQQGSMAYMDGI